MCFVCALLVIAIVAGALLEIGGLVIGYRTIQSDWGRSMELALHSREPGEVLDEMLVGDARGRRRAALMFGLGVVLAASGSLASLWVNC